jgi:membrane protein
MLTAYHYSARLLSLIWQTVVRFESMERRRDAAALTYTTLFALVPVITVTYSIIRGMPSLQALGQQAHTDLLTYVMPEGSELISEYLVRFSEQAQQLTWLGVVFLFATALLLLKTVEEQFNRIWRVEVARSAVQRFFRYWAVLSLGPVLFVIAQGVSSLLASLALFETGDLPWAAVLLPWFLTTAAVAFVYMLVPNCRVPSRDAVIAALLVASVFESGKFLFARIIGLFPSYQLIYGAFAAVPLFLMWVYLSWLVVLFGAELTYSLSHPHGRSRLDPVRQRLHLLQAMLTCQREGHAFDEANIRSGLTDISASQASSLLQQFRRHGWVHQTQDESWVWLPDLRYVSAADFFGDLTLQQLGEAAGVAIQEDGEPAGIWLRYWQANGSSALELTLDEIINHTPLLAASGAAPLSLPQD